MMVHDVQHGEWTFISGGKKLSESFNQSAIRETYEETRGVIHLSQEHMDQSSFYDTKVLHSTSSNPRFSLHTVYRVYFVNLRLASEIAFRTLEDTFRASISHHKDMNENDDARFFPVKDIKHLPSVWSFIRNIIYTRQFTMHVRNILRNTFANPYPFWSHKAARVQPPAFSYAQAVTNVP